MIELNASEFDVAEEGAFRFYNVDEKCLCSIVVLGSYRSFIASHFNCYALIICV